MDIEERKGMIKYGALKRCGYHVGSGGINIETEKMIIIHSLLFP